MRAHTPFYAWKRQPHSYCPAFRPSVAATQYTRFNPFGLERLAGRFSVLVWVPAGVRASRGHARGEIAGAHPARRRSPRVYSRAVLKTWHGGRGVAMILGLDHSVIVVRDLASAVRDYTALGFTVTPGGTHADGLTHNALVSFADGSYFELLAFTNPGQATDHPWWHRLAEGEGLEDYALASDDLAGDVAACRRRGLAIGDPMGGGRQRPDGRTLRRRPPPFVPPPPG